MLHKQNFETEWETSCSLTDEGEKVQSKSPMRLKGPHAALLSPWLNRKQLFSSVFCRLDKCQSIKMTNAVFFSKDGSLLSPGKQTCMSTSSKTNDSRGLKNANITPRVFISPQDIYAFVVSRCYTRCTASCFLPSWLGGTLFSSFCHRSSLPCKRAAGLTSNQCVSVTCDGNISGLWLQMEMRRLF